MISGNIVRKREEEERLLLGTEEEKDKVNLLQRKRRTSPGRVSFIECLVLSQTQICGSSGSGTCRNGTRRFLAGSCQCGEAWRFLLVDG